MIEKVKSAAKVQSEGYEISVKRSRGEEMAADFYRFFYGEAESDPEEICGGEEEMTRAEHTAFLKCACLLFAAAVGIVLAVMLV